eukprot:12934428-Prorocentrum_lima.AAC.1
MHLPHGRQQGQRGEGKRGRERAEEGDRRAAGRKWARWGGQVRTMRRVISVDLLVRVRACFCARAHTCVR